MPSFKIEIDITVKSFPVPSYVETVQDGIPNMSLREIPADVLLQMADEWRRDLFHKADKTELYFADKTPAQLRAETIETAQRQDRPLVDVVHTSA